MATVLSQSGWEKPKRLWILFPTVEEASIAFLSRARWQRFDILEYFSFHKDNCHGFVFVIGVGKEADASLEYLWRFAQTCEENYPDLVILAGFAGACQPGVKTGDLFVVKSLLGVKCNKVCLLKSFAVPNLVDSLDGCVCVSLERVAGKLSKEELGNQGVDMVEMELGWIWESFENRGVPLISVRVILDELEDEIPAGLGGILVRGRVKVFRLAKWVICGGLFDPGLFKLKSKVNLAKKNLAQGLNFMISRLF